MPRINQTFASIALAALSVLAPAAAFAQTSTLSTVIDTVVNLISDALFLLMAVAVLVFVWQVIRYFVLPNEDRKGAGLYVMYAVIGFFVIFSLWGLVNILSGTFHLTSSGRSWTDLKSSLFPH